MKKKFQTQSISLSDFQTLMKAAFIGFAAAESWHFGRQAAAPINAWLTAFDPFHVWHAFCWLLGLFLIVMASFAFLRGTHSHLKRVAKSCRFDLLAGALIGAWLSVIFDTPGSLKLARLLAKTTAPQLLFLASLPILAMLVLALHIGSVRLRLWWQKTKAPFFINDEELADVDSDLLGVRGAAERFAERIVNGGSMDCIVFGIDAPWGSGKSTFLNFCVKSLEAQKDDVIVYRFNPLQYQDLSKIFERFVGGLIQAIQKEAFIPEIRSLIFAYSKLVKGKVSFNYLGLRFDPVAGDVDEAFEDLAEALIRLNRKIIVMIDDLDRLSFSQIKDILFSIKKSFMLPNVTYVLCYDTENISALADAPSDAQNVREFLEKFVNVKLSLFLDARSISDYVSNNLERALGANLHADPVALAQTKSAIQAIQRICDSEDFHLYSDFLGDLRKVKRLINAVLSFEIGKTEFETTDVDQDDLIHLVLIYVNFPHIFRKIYNTETGGKSGFFSALHPFDPEYPRPVDGVKLTGPRNSARYVEYLKGLSDGQQFLLNKIFLVPDRMEKDEGDTGRRDQARMSLACFNENGRRNLERHLYLVVKLSKPIAETQHRFYVFCKNRLKEGASVESIFKEKEFSAAVNEDNYKQFWGVAAKSAEEFAPEVVDEILEYLVEHLPDFCMVDIKTLSLGARDHGAYFLLSFLDKAVWADPSDRRGHGDDSEVARISARIFGDGEYAGQGVMRRLAASERGPLGFFDALLFRLYCSSDRDGGFRNLYRSLALRADPNAPRSGSVVDLAIDEVRQISQLVFGLFDEQYILKRQSFFAAVDDVPLFAMTGKFNAALEAALQSGQIDKNQLDRSVIATRARAKSFVIYQLVNRLTDAGIGCGRYDQSGAADQGGIFSRMNDYLFDVCFIPGAGTNGSYEAFADFLLSNYPNFPMWPFNKVRWLPSIEVWERVLDRAKLAEYWIVHRAAIVQLALTSTDKEVIVGSSSLTYKENLPDVFEALDSLVDGPKSEPITMG